MENQNRSNYQDSKLHLYKQLTTLRKKEPVFATGSTALFSSKEVFAFARYDSNVTYVSVVNVKVLKVNVDLSDIVRVANTSGEVVFWWCWAWGSCGASPKSVDVAEGI